MDGPAALNEALFFPVQVEGGAGFGKGIIDVPRSSTGGKQSVRAPFRAPLRLL